MWSVNNRRVEFTFILQLVSLQLCTQFGGQGRDRGGADMVTMEGWLHNSPANPFSLNQSPSLTRFWVGDRIFLPQGLMLDFATFRVSVTRAVQWLRAAAAGGIRKWYHPRRSAESVRRARSLICFQHVPVGLERRQVGLARTGCLFTQKPRAWGWTRARASVCVCRTHPAPWVSSTHIINKVGLGSPWCSFKWTKVLKKKPKKLKNLAWSWHTGTLSYVAHVWHQ